MKRTLLMSSLAGLAGMAGFKKLRKAKRNPAEKFKNAQGIGPAHMHGVPRGEDWMGKSGSDEVTSVAGRIAGSIHPQSRGPEGSPSKRFRLGRGRRASVRLASVSRLAPAPVPAAGGGPGGASKWASSFAH